MSKPMVSVWCTAYNHEKYIREALESFVSQKTNFSFEVLINDDASKDRTREIIQEYADKYPDIIKPVFQAENQYSQGVHILTQILLPKSEGKYFALCEGDDYWTDPYKLQKQVDYMQAHPECSMCIHNSTYVTEAGAFLKEHTISAQERDVSTEEVILGGGDFCSTNSILAPIALAKNLPECFYVLKMDYAWQTCLASMGTVHCFSESMSAYRTFSQGSWSSRVARGCVDGLVENSKSIISYLDAFDAQTKQQYHQAVIKQQSNHLLTILLCAKSKDILADGYYAEIYKCISLPKKMQVNLKINCPHLYNLVRKLLHKSEA